MFAYCGNSPVSYVDPSGYLFVPYDTLPGWTEDPSENSSPESRQSLGEIEITVLKAKGISVYNGVPVIKLPFGGDVGFSAGVIFWETVYQLMKMAFLCSSMNMDTLFIYRRLVGKAMSRG